MSDLATAAALVLVLEGAAWALFPDAMRRLMEQALAMDPQQLRIAGVTACVLGVGMVWAIRSAAG